MRNRKLAGVLGLVFVVLSSIILFVAPAFPTFQTPQADTLRYYIDNGRAFLWANYLATVALIPSLFFASYFADRLEPNTKATCGPTRSLFLLATGISHAMAFVSLLGFQIAALASQPGQEVLIKLVSDASNIAFCFYLMLQALYVGLFASMALCSGLLPKWLGWVAIPIIGASIAASVGTVYPVGPLIPGELFVMIASVGIGLWMGAASVTLLVTKPAQD